MLLLEEKMQYAGSDVRRVSLGRADGFDSGLALTIRY